MVTPSGKMTHGCALRLLEANLAIHPEPRGQHSRYPDEFLGEIDASHPTALVPGEVARRTSDPRSDLEQMAGLEATSPQAPGANVGPRRAEPLKRNRGALPAFSMA
jgi:hypothetical protein